MSASDVFTPRRPPAEHPRPRAAFSIGTARPLAVSWIALALALQLPTGRAAAAPAPFPVDSLLRDDTRRARLIAPDLGALAMLRRESEYSVNQFRRYLGTYPPVLGIAALGTMPDPSRVSDAALNLADYRYVLRDWPARPGTPRPVADSTATEWPEPASERIMRWYLPIIERDLGRGTPAEGRTRFTPDWFESALAGFATLPGEQNVRVTWMDAHMKERIPIAKLLQMSRPPAKVKGARRKAGAAEPSRRLFDAEALSFARFLSHREGERFIGHWYERILAGDTQMAAFNIAKTLLPAPEVLEKEWIVWVNEGPAKKINTPGARGDETE